MNTETIEINDYKVVIAMDTCPINPFEDWDCLPPLLTYHEDITTYGNVPDMEDLVKMIPDEYFARGKRVANIKRELNCTIREFQEYMRLTGDGVRGTFAYFLEHMQCPKPDYRSWRTATAYFECLEWLCGLAGVPCYYTESHGYSQRDSALVMAFATPEWVKKVGTTGDLEKQCKDACELYGHWAWGDVYGIADIIDPDGHSIEDASVWGFYGPDHEKSGLLENAKESIEYHKRQRIKEEAEARAMACRDIVTV